MSTARCHACAFLSLAFVVYVVCSVLFEAASAHSQAQPSQFEEFLLTLDTNETETVANTPRHQPTPSNAETAVQSEDGASVTRSDSPGGASASDRATTSEDVDEEEEGEEEDDPLNGQTSTELLSYFRYVPRAHWSCCMLGLLAGNKGFQCRADFYSSSITLRNFNRPHTGRHSGRTRGYEIMRTFRRCVTSNANEFHRCCHVAVTERHELSVARSYRSRPNRSSST